MTVDANPTIRVLSDEECWQRLADHPAGSGRVGTGGPSPDILPVTYVLDGRSVVFRTGQGRKLAAREMLAWKISALPVVQRQRVVGIVTTTDCLAAMLLERERRRPMASERRAGA